MPDLALSFAHRRSSPLVHLHLHLRIHSGHHLLQHRPEHVGPLCSDGYLEVDYIADVADLMEPGDGSASGADANGGFSASSAFAVGGTG